MEFVSILNPASTQKEASSGGDTAQAQVKIGPFGADALVLVTATGGANYSGPTMNAGIVLTLNVDNKPVSRDECFEGESSSIDFHSAAAHNFTLKKGKAATIEARVDRYGAGVTNKTKVALTCFALAVKK